MKDIAIGTIMALAVAWLASVYQQFQENKELLRSEVQAQLEERQEALQDFQRLGILPAYLQCLEEEGPTRYAVLGHWVMLWFHEWKPEARRAYAHRIVVGCALRIVRNPLYAEAHMLNKYRF